MAKPLELARYPFLLYSRAVYLSGPLGLVIFRVIIMLFKAQYFPDKSQIFSAVRLIFPRERLSI